MKIYSGEVCLGVCGEPTQMFDDYCDWLEGDSVDNFSAVPNLCVGDQVVAVVRNHWKDEPDYISDINVVCDDNGRQFIMGLASIDFTTENEERAEWMIKKVKDWKDCVNGERVPNCAQIRYVEED